MQLQNVNYDNSSSNLHYSSHNVGDEYQTIAYLLNVSVKRNVFKMAS